MDAKLAGDPLVVLLPNIAETLPLSAFASIRTKS
jgi:hypothetical protein